MNIQGEPRVWTYEELCDLGRAKSEDLDNLRWLLGDLGNQVITQYGDKTIESFARDIGQRKSTCYQYAAVANFYAVENRGQIRDTMPNVNYSMMRDAMRFKDITKAIDWLNEVSIAGMSADEASRKLTEKLGRDTRDTIQGHITGYDGRNLLIEIDMPINAFTYEQGQSVTLRVK